MFLYRAYGHTVEHLNSAPAAVAAAVYYYTIFYVNFVYALYHSVEWLYVGVFVAEKVVAHFTCILLSSFIRFFTSSPFTSLHFVVVPNTVHLVREFPFCHANIMMTK